MNPWIRLYRKSMHNPKVVTLNDRQHRAWHNCLLSADDAGVLPKIRDIACHMRMTIPEAEMVLSELVEAGLVDVDCTNPNARRFTMHDWAEHQFISDVSTVRVKKFRSKNNSNVNETFQKRRETPSESDTDTDTESKFQLSEQDAARRKLELGINSNSKSGLDRKGMETLLRQAEGYGLDVADIVEITNRNAKPAKREGYFVTLCINRLKDKLPGLDEQIIRAALNGKHEQNKTVLALLTGALQ